jgi:hypothetical protein
VNGRNNGQVVVDWPVTSRPATTANRSLLGRVSEQFLYAHLTICDGNEFICA